MSYKEELKELSKRLEEEYLRSYSKQIGKVAKKRLFGTLFFNFYELRKNFEKNLDPFVLISIEQRMNWISDWLTQEVWGHFFGNLYLIERSLYFNNRPELKNRLHWTIGDLYTAHALVLQGNNLSDSLGSAFLDRLAGIVKVDCQLIDNKDKEFFKLATINLCTINSVLCDYLSLPNILADQKTMAKKYLRSSFESLKRAFLETAILDNNISLQLFIYRMVGSGAKILDEKIESLQDHYNDLLKQLETRISELNAYDRILSLCSLYYLNKEKFADLFEKSFEDLSSRVNWINRPFYVKMLILYLRNKEIGIEPIDLKIKPLFRTLDVEEIIKKLFPDYFSVKRKGDVTVTDLEILMSYDDPQIRESLANIFGRSMYLDEPQKMKLLEEARKPHTPSEISDFEVKLALNQFDSIYVCLPIKSGREIKTDTVPEKYAYQIMKPFIHLYNNCVVIFITAKKCSQALDAYIKKLKALYGFPIEVIQERTLCDLLKFYGQLNRNN